MKITDTRLAGMKLLEPRVFGDGRGSFFETFRQDWFRDKVARVEFVQQNHSVSIAGTLRGLHYQLQQPQGKLIQVVVGEIFDVGVDLRCNSPTFGGWVGHWLSADNKRQLWIPAGFAHGFYVTSTTAQCLYQCTDYYAPQFEHRIKWDDGDLAINWPINDATPPVLSARDAQASTFKKSPIFDL